MTVKLNLTFLSLRDQHVVLLKTFDQLVVVFTIAATVRNDALSRSQMDDQTL